MDSCIPDVNLPARKAMYDNSHVFFDFFCSSPVSLDAASASLGEVDHLTLWVAAMVALTETCCSRKPVRSLRVIYFLVQGFGLGV